MNVEISCALKTDFENIDKHDAHETGINAVATRPLWRGQNINWTFLLKRSELVGINCVLDVNKNRKSKQKFNCLNI